MCLLCLFSGCLADQKKNHTFQRLLNSISRGFGFVLEILPSQKTPWKEVYKPLCNKSTLELHKNQSIWISIHVSMFEITCIDGIDDAYFILWGGIYFQIYHCCYLSSYLQYLYLIFQNGAHLLMDERRKSGRLNCWWSLLQSSHETVSKVLFVAR